MPRKISKSDREVQLSALALADGYEFVGWVGEFSGVFSRCAINCIEHGQWVTTVDSMRNGYRCPICGGSGRMPQTMREQKLSRGEFTFVSWVDGYKHSRSRAIINCSTHGEWVADSNDFINKASGCPSCAETGYKVAIPGVLYALLSECTTMVKIGITNRKIKRYRTLRWVTPFKFSVHREITCGDGSVPPMLEKLFHFQFPSAGLTGFNGATEWRQMSPDVTTWLDLLQ